MFATPVGSPDAAKGSPFGLDRKCPAKPLSDKQVDQSDHKTARELIEARAASGLTQQEAAQLIGVNAQTISRWERGERRISKADYDRAMAVYAAAADRHATPTELGQNVSRGTSRGGFRFDRVREAAAAADRYRADGGGVRLPADLEVARAKFLAEASARGATRDDLDYILSVLNSPETQQLFAGGYRSAKSLEEAKLEMETVVEMLDRWLSLRLTRRAEDSEARR